MTNRKTLTCRCGRRVLVGIETEAARCWACTGFIGDPKGDGGLSLDAPHRRDIAECCNYSAGACIVRAAGQCIVLDGQRCGWWEKAVRPAGRMGGRICAVCGSEVPKRRRFCDRCRQARRRSAYRESKRRKRVSCPQLTAPPPLNCQEFEAAQGTFREGRPGVAAHAQSVDMGEISPEFAETLRAHDGRGGRRVVGAGLGA